MMTATGSENAGKTQTIKRKLPLFGRQLSLFGTCLQE
jgi:hypothetical protein